MVLEIIAIIVSVLTPIGAFLGSLIIYKKQAKEREKDRQHDSDENQKKRDYDFEMRLFGKTPKEAAEIIENWHNNQNLITLNKNFNNSKKEKEKN